MSCERDGPVLCPSAPAAPGATLIGLVGAQGRVVHLVTPLTIDATFIASAEQVGPLGKRFRFSSPCQESRCGHWAGSECSLIGRLHEAAIETGHAGEGAPLPACTIRGQCRWWAQRGRQACSVCTVVVTDPRPSTAGATGA